MKLSKLVTLWYENENGDKWIPKLTGDGDPMKGRPEGFIYQHSRFPTQLRTSVLLEGSVKEVGLCQHPMAAIRSISGLRGGLKGRKCGACSGTQVVEEDIGWPRFWKATGSREVFAMNEEWCDKLAVALHTSSLPSTWGVSDLSLSEAILIAATACERCSNAMAHHLELGFGYPEGGKEWSKCGTSCELCEPGS
jgi:hypothetical protein